jgi:hypothetical protein
MAATVEKLERDLRWLKVYAVILTMLIILFALWMIGPARSSNVILRARGLIIEDELGRERILLGAPIPAAGNRVRTDVDRVRQIWAPRFPDPERYMGWYREYRHDMNGLMILNEEGFDRIAVGDPVPDPNIGRRIAPSSGITIHDEQGFERGGYGYLDGRVVLGLDHPGREGVALVLGPKGRAGIVISPESGRGGMFIGIDSTHGSNGLFMRDSSGAERARLGVWPDQSTSLEVRDKGGARVSRIP